MTPPKPSGARRLLPFLFLVVLSCIAWFATEALGKPSPDPTDEVEWTAISIVHRAQLGGLTPPGVALDERNGKLHEDPWRQGVQATTFGWPNPGLHKKLWGFANRDVDPGAVRPELFFRYNRGNPAMAAAAAEPLQGAVERSRRLVAMASAACAVLLFLIAKRVAGPVAGGLAMGLWLFHPLVRQWSHQARPDFGMVALLLATLWLAMAGASVFRGEHGTLKRWGLFAVLGLFAGLCVATKLNGALASFFVALALPLILIRRGERYDWKALLLAWVLCASVILGTLWVNFPYLWSDPLGHLSEVLAFWEKHMEFQRTRWESAGGIAARTLGERVDLAVLRIGGNHEPLRALLHLPGGVLWIALGFLGLLNMAIGRGKQLAPRLLIVGALVIWVGTTLWLPLDWDRYYFAPVAASILVEASCLGLLAKLALGRLKLTGSKAPETSASN